MLKPVDVFNSWALNGKDEGMQKNHSIAVDSMMQMLIENSNKKSNLRVRKMHQS